MSLRLRLLGAFAYGFLLILVALEVPLVLLVFFVQLAALSRPPETGSQ